MGRSRHWPGRRHERRVAALVVVSLACSHCGHEETVTVEPGTHLACPRCHLWEGRIRWLMVKRRAKR